MSNFFMIQDKWENNFKRGRVKSQVELKRLRCDSLERAFKENIYIIKSLKESGHDLSIFDDYFKWVKKSLNVDDLNVINKDKNNSLEKELRYFENKIRNTLLNLVYLQNNTPSPLSIVKSNSFDYGKFIHDGIISFVNFIDSYQLWLEPKELRRLVYTNTPNTLSYVLIASLARFTLSRKDPRYHLIYKKSIRNARKSLPEAYMNPSYHNIVALGLLTHLSLSHFNADNVLRYFSMAVSMAQTLGYDKIKDSMCPSTKAKESLEEQRKGSRLWGALSLTYLLLFTISPGFPSFNFKPKIIELIHPTDDQIYQESLVNFETEDPFQATREVFFASSIGNKLTEMFLTITSHIQFVRLGAPSGDVSKIDPISLRLPSKNFNKILTTLMSFQISAFVNPLNHGKLSKMVEFKAKAFPNENGQSNNQYDTQFETITQLIYIFLYYPSILVYPQPVELSIEEDEILYHAANCITDYFKGVLKEIESFDTKLFDKNEVKTRNLLCKTNSSSLYYIQSSYSIYVYFNIISRYNSKIFDERYRSMVETSISNALFILNFLYWIKDFIKDDQLFNPKCALGFIVKAMDRYNLPNDFYISAANYLNL